MKTDPTKVKPLGKTILVQREEANLTTKGGIHLPENAVERPPEATVVQIGTGAKSNDTDWEGFEVDPGDVVLLERYGGTDLGDGFAILPETCVLGILEDDNKIAPIGTNVIVRMMPPEEQKGKIILPEFSKETQEFGVVVAVAERCKHIQEDDFVFVAKTQGAHYRVGGDDFIVIREDKIHATVEKETE